MPVAREDFVAALKTLRGAGDVGSGQVYQDLPMKK